MTTASSKAFDIPELAQRIANSLTQHDLATCCLVSQSFFATFNPHLWHSIIIQRHDPIPKFQSPEGQEGLLRNGHLIRVLRTFSLHTLAPFVEHGVSCTNLVALDVEYDAVAPGTHTRMYNDRTPVMRARCGWSRSGSGAGQRQVQRPEETFEERIKREYPVGARDLELARAEPEFQRMLLAVGGEEQAPDGWVMSTVFLRAREKVRARRDMEDIEILRTILERNRRIEFVIVPDLCLKSEAVVKVAVEVLLELREIYSATAFAIRGTLARFTLSAERQKPDCSRNIPSFTSSLLQQQQDCTEEDQMLRVEGSLCSAREAASWPLMNGHPRLKDLELEMVKTMNQRQLEQIRISTSGTGGNLLPCIEISYGQTAEIIQILREIPEGMLTSITISRFYVCPFTRTEPPIDKIGPSSALLKHALTLEHFFARACGIESKAIQELLCASPRLRSLEGVEEDLVMFVDVKAELDAVDAVRSPWVCKELEVFECRISRVPRPDVTWTSFYHELSHELRPTIPHHPQGPVIVPGSPQEIIQRESHALQRRILNQLGRLTHLRVLTLGTERRDYGPHGFYQLVIRGFKTHIVSALAQHSCLELTLESGLDELAGLKELEELNVGQMGHRIGLAEVQWMVAQWPKLKSIVGLTCLNYNNSFFPEGEGEVEVDDGDEWPPVERDIRERVPDLEPEHVVWIRKHRPDIHCPYPK